MPRNRLPLLALALAALTCLGGARVSDAEPQAFHHIEINKLLVGYNGNMNIQAVELRLLSAGEVFVNGAFLAVYDSIGDPVATLGAFTSNVANGSVGDRILCATAAFASAFSITPDLVISPGIPMVTGQVSFETATCLINSLPYGNVLTRVSGVSNAQPLPPHGATALVRIASNPTLPSCPLAENAASRFQLQGAGSANRFVFQNNARDTAQVWTSITSVEQDPAPPVAATLRASPNPFTASTTIRISGGATRVSVYDVSGRLVRTWSPAPKGGDIGETVWDGLDQEGRPGRSGLYFVEAATVRGPVRGRVILLR